MAPRAGGHGRGNATACPFLETSAPQRSLALQALWGHGKHPSPTGESAKHQVTKCLGDCKAPGCGALVLSPTAGVWKPGLWARCEMSGEVSAPRGTEGFLLPARIRFGRSWERARPSCQRGERALCPAGRGARLHRCLAGAGAVTCVPPGRRIPGALPPPLLRPICGSSSARSATGGSATATARRLQRANTSQQSAAQR